MTAPQPDLILPALAVVLVEALSPDEKAVIIDLCGRAFEEDFTPLFTLLPASTHVLARRHGQLVGHACWVARWLQPAGLPPLRTAYVEAVASEPALQRRGIGTAVLRRLAEGIQDFALGALSTGSAPFYTRLGWERWQGPTAIRREDGLLPTQDEGVMILRTPHTPPLDVQSLLTAEWREGDLW